MSLFKGSEPRMSRQRVPYTSQNFGSACFLIGAITLFALLVGGFCFFKYFDSQPPTPAEIKHREYVEAQCQKLPTKDRYDCIKEAEGWNTY